MFFRKAEAQEIVARKTRLREPKRTILLYYERKGTYKHFDLTFSKNV